MTKVKDLIRKKRPIVVDIQSAVHLGLNDAIVLQQIHYWIDSNEEREIEHVFKQGQWWTYGTYEEWQKRDFPFWSVSTVKRAFLSLERRGAIRSATLNKYAGDRTKWYTLNYDADIDPVNDGTDQIDPMVTDQIESMEQTKLTHSNNKESKPKRVKRDSAPNGTVPKPLTAQQQMYGALEEHRHARCKVANTTDYGKVAKQLLKEGIAAAEIANLYRHTAACITDLGSSNFTVYALVKYCADYIANRDRYIKHEAPPALDIDTSGIEVPTDFDIDSAMADAARLLGGPYATDDE